MNRNVDICCGAGGMSCGFQLARKGDHWIGVDIWQLALQTYRDNIENSETIWASIDPRDAKRKLVPQLDWTTLGKVDVLVAGIPCPPFSGANIRGNRNYDSTLVESFLSIRDAVKPRWWVMEESPFAAFLFDEPRFMKANDHGLHQERKRLIMGNHPDPTPGRHWKRAHPAIRAQEVKAYNKNMRHSKRAMSCCQWFGRRLTSWDFRVLMGFPGEYVFHGDYRERCIQIGNAVCPPVAKAIYEAILGKENCHWIDFLGICCHPNANFHPCESLRTCKGRDALDVEFALEMSK